MIAALLPIGGGGLRQLGQDGLHADALARQWRRQVQLDRLPAFPDRRSPCRIDAAKGPRRHHCSPWHAELVTSYRDARHADELRMDEVAMGYPREETEYRRDVGLVDFGQWLRGHRRG